MVAAAAYLWLGRHLSSPAGQAAEPEEPEEGTAAVQAEPLLGRS